MAPVSPGSPGSKDTPKDLTRKSRTDEVVKTDSSAPRVELDSDSYELGQALKQIHSSEQRLKREMRELKEENATFAKERDRALSQLKSLEEELHLAKNALQSREVQIRSFSATRASQAARDVEERKYLKEQIELSHQKYDQLVQQYDELYQYCESLLAESEKKRKHAEVRAKEVTAAFQQLEKKHQRLEKDYQTAFDAHAKMKVALVARDAELKSTQVATTQEIAGLKKSYEEALSLFEQTKGRTNRTRLENSSLETRLAMFEQAYEAAVPNTDRARDGLGKTAKTLEDLQRALRNFFEQAQSRGITPVSLKAGKLMAEQMRLEIENLKRLDPLLRNLADVYAGIGAISQNAAKSDPEGEANR